MNALKRFLLGTCMLGLLVAGPGCSSAEGEEDEEEGELGAEDSGKVIPTSQTDLLLYQGYSMLFDQGHNSCVQPQASVTPQVGDVGVDVKINLVRSREELARSLGFDTELGFKLPKAGADARASLMNSFKRNSSTTTLLVRVGAYYFIDAGQTYSLTPTAAELLKNDPRGFLQRCGDAVVTKLQYRAEVLGLMKFDSNDQESTLRAAGDAKVDVPAAGSIADASAKVKATYERMSQSSRAAMNLELYTQGFSPGGDVSIDNLQGDQAMGRLQDLLKKMADTIAADRARDVEHIKQGNIPAQGTSDARQAGERAVVQRAARLGAITFHAYSKNISGSFAPVTKLTQDASAFLHAVGDVQSRLENTYQEEVNAFITARDQEAYNLSSGAKPTVAELEAPAQKWAGLLKPTEGAGTVAAQLKEAQLGCVRFMISGDGGGQCVKTPAIEKLLVDGNKQLEDYTREGRVVRMNILYGSEAVQTVDNAKAACTRTGGRLPLDTEMEWLKPALAAKGGFAWVQSQQCPKNIGIYTGKEQPQCYNGWYMDWYDGLLDATGLSKRAAPVFCVANAGPRSALGRPGE